MTGQTQAPNPTPPKQAKNSRKIRLFSHSLLCPMLALFQKPSAVTDLPPTTKGTGEWGWRQRPRPYARDRQPLCLRSYLHLQRNAAQVQAIQNECVGHQCFAYNSGHRDGSNCRQTGDRSRRQRAAFVAIFESGEMNGQAVKPARLGCALCWRDSRSGLRWHSRKVRL